MFLRTASTGLLVALGALGAWAGTQALDAEPAPRSAPDAAPPESERSPQVPAAGPATASGPWSAEVQVSSGQTQAVGAVGQTLAVLPDGTRLIVWRGGGRGGTAVLSRSRDGVSWSAPTAIPGTEFTQSPNIAAAPDGTVHLIWGQRRGPKMTMLHMASRDGGRSWGGATQLSPYTTDQQRGQAIAIDDKGRVHVAWHLGDPQQGTTPATVWYTRSGPGGRGFSAPQQLGGSLAGHAAFPRLVLTGASGDVVAVPYRAQQDPPDWDVLVSVSRDGGKTFTTHTAVDTPFRDWDPEAWVDADDVIHLAWMTQRGGGKGVTVDYARSSDFGRTWTTPISLNQVTGRFPSWAADPDGRSAWLLWKDERDWGTPPCVGRERCADLIGAFTSNGGRTWTQPELFTDKGSVEVKFPSVTVDDQGQLHVMWSDRRQAVEQIFYQVRQSP